MYYPGSVQTTPSKPFSLPRKAVRSVMQGLFAVVLAGCLAVPGLAQTPAQASGAGKADEKPVKRDVKPAGKSQAKTSATASQRTMKAPKGQIALPSRVVLIFATDSKGGVSDQISDVITDTIQGRLAASGQYDSVYFLRSIPTVKRALNEGTLTPNEVAHPYDDDTKLKKLMPLTSYDMAMTTSIDSYTYDEKKNQVTMLISARLIDFSGAKPVVRAAAENGSSPENGGNAKELAIASRLAKDLTEKLMTSLVAPTKRMETTSPGADTAPTTTNKK